MEDFQFGIHQPRTSGKISWQMKLAWLMSLILKAIREDVVKFSCHGVESPFK